MARLGLIYICLAGDLQLILSVGLKDAPTLGSKNNPRLLSKGNVHLSLLHQMLLQDFTFYTGVNVYEYKLHCVNPVFKSSFKPAEI